MSFPPARSAPLPRPEGRKEMVCVPNTLPRQAPKRQSTPPTVVSSLRVVGGHEASALHPGQHREPLGPRTSLPWPVDGRNGPSQQSVPSTHSSPGRRAHRCGHPSHPPPPSYTLESGLQSESPKWHLPRPPGDSPQRQQASAPTSPGCGRVLSTVCPSLPKSPQVFIGMEAPPPILWKDPSALK